MKGEKLRYLINYQDRDIIKRSDQATEEEQKSIMEKLTFYQRKYPNYFELLYSKNCTEEEERDLKLWLYWQQKYFELS